MGERIDTEKMKRIREEAAKLGTSYYKFVEPFIINVNDQIGKGSYGMVYKGADIRNGNLIAVKTISTTNIKKDPEKFYDSLKNEIEIMKALKHPNIVQLFDVKKSANNIYLFQELCDKGSLEDVLNNRKKLPEAEVLVITKQLVAGYKYLYQNKIIHRDLKPANILIKDELYKIADFGFAKYYSEGSELDMVHQSLVGSPIYMCPEILNGQSYSTKSDVWSLGIILFQMLYGKTPHRASSLQQLVMKVNKKVIRYPQRLNNQALQSLLDKMLQHDPNERYSWKEVFDHEIFVEKKKPNSINDSMQIAEKGAKNKLEMSTKMNQVYFQDKKVIEQIEIVQGEMEEQKSMSTGESANTEKEKDVYKNIAQRHEQTEVKKAIIRRIKNWFLFKRNKAVFLNHLSLKIHNCFALEKLDIPLSKAEIFILVLSKWQCMITYKSYIRLKEGKVNSQAFTNEQYDLFVNSPLRQKIMEKFKNDFTVMKMFFDQLMKKVQGYIAAHEGNLPENLVRIKKICNQNLCPRQLFSEIFAENIDQLYEICKRAMAKHKTCREVVQLTFLVNEALKLKKGELETTEFSMIYDQEQKLTNDELINKIEGTYVDSNMND